MKQKLIKNDLKYLRHELAIMFNSKTLWHDLIAGITVAFIAIPLSLAIAMASNVPPTLALTSAVIGGIIAAIFGGTRLCVTGPAIAMSMIIAQCVATNGLSSLLIIGLICGILQLLSGILRLGYFVKLVPSPVIAAFIAAIGCFILIGEIPRALELSTQVANSSEFSIFTLTSYSIHQINVQAMALAILTIILLFIASKFLPKTPAILLAIIIPTGLANFFNLKLALVGLITPNIIHIPVFPDFANINFSHIFEEGFAVFILASLETILSASKIDSFKKAPIMKPNLELIGQGIANITTAIFGGIPVTGVVVRSRVNINSGAKTRASAIIHAIVILLIIYHCPQIIAMIPVSVLAGILITAAITMINIRSLVSFWQHDKIEAAIFLITFILIVTTDLINGIEIGILLTSVIVSIRLLATKINIKLGSDKNVVRVALSGNMTFWSFDKLNELELQLLDQEHTLKFVIFEFHQLQGLDSTGTKHLIDLAITLNQRQLQVIFHGLTKAQLNRLESQIITEYHEKPFVTTITENEIKNILETAGITYHANDTLKHGISKFQDNYARHNPDIIDALALGQNPHTLLITCSDSRLNPNSFLSVDLGEVFMVRNVGNVVPPYNQENKYSEGAAIEFAIDVLKIRNIVICAHSECGAIKASLENLNTHNDSGLDNWLKIIKLGFLQQLPENLDKGVEINLLNQITNLKTYPNIATLLKANEITISAWVYDVHSAQILEWNGNNFTPIQEEIIHS